MDDLFYLLASLVALLTALLVGGMVEQFIIRPIARKRGWYE